MRPTKARVGGAAEVGRPREGRYAGCERVVLACDNPNTHAPGASGEAFEPERARRLVRRMRFCHTPKHGRWLNVAEREPSAFTRQCVDGRRFGGGGGGGGGDGDGELRREASAWSSDCNGRRRGVAWQLTVDDARVKRISVYPKILM